MCLWSTLSAIFGMKFPKIIFWLECYNNPDKTVILTKFSDSSRDNNTSLVLISSTVFLWQTALSHMLQCFFQSAVCCINSVLVMPRLQHLKSWGFPQLLSIFAWCAPSCIPRDFQQVEISFAKSSSSFKVGTLSGSFWPALWKTLEGCL